MIYYFRYIQIGEVGIRYGQNGVIIWDNIYKIAAICIFFKETEAVL